MNIDFIIALSNISFINIIFPNKNMNSAILTYDKYYVKFIKKNHPVVVQYQYYVLDTRIFALKA